MKLIRPDGSVVSSQDVENVFTWADGRATWREWDYDGIETFPYTVQGRWEPDPMIGQGVQEPNVGPENPNMKAEQAPKSEPMEPPPGSWAAVARMMAAGDDSGFDWDAWKDEMKERDL